MDPAANEKCQKKSSGGPLVSFLNMHGLFLYY